MQNTLSQHSSGSQAISRSAETRLRSGFSLMELLIVLGVLVVVAAVAAPPMMSRVREGQVQEAAEAVREVLAATRTFAIDSGVDYHFRYEIGGHAFVAIPAEREPEAGNSLDADGATADFRAWAGDVAETMFLRNAAGDNSSGGTLEAADFSNLPNAGELAAKTWSAPILFRFDGSSEDKSFRVQDEEKRTAILSVRGLTGAIRISRVAIREDEQ